MDGLVQPRDRERSLYASPSFPRAPSRSSTSTSATRRTSHSANSSSSRLVSSPRPASSHPSHRFHHTSCAQSTVTSRPASVASRDRGSESGRHSAASSYLQGKLQKRREEAERLAAQSTQSSNASMEPPPRNIQGSPLTSFADGHTPRSGGNGEPPKTGMGLKEMEATVSTLHKQNFDLKLELFHRRERQNVLEERIDAIEAEKAQIDEVNDKLLDELEKRDKAVQEAVQMIVALEAEVEKLAREREMVRKIDEAGLLELDHAEARLSGPTPKARTADLARLEADAKALNRMPSFMSDRTENTEHLRKVYLNSRGSILSLHKGAAEGTEEEGRRVNSLTSPSLSVLSEGSFASIYGDREDQDETIVAGMDGSPGINGTSQSPPPKLSRSSGRPVSQRPASTMPARLGQSGRSASVTRTPGPGQFQSIQDIIDHTSPLQKIARLDPAYYEESPTQDHLLSASRAQSYRHTNGAKRETLRRVTTDGPPIRSGDQALPPTPDTISTSTLRRFKNSDDTLPQQRDVSGQRSYQSVSDTTSKADDAEHGGGAPVFHQPLVSGFGNEPISASHFTTRPPLIARPRSADESTVSRRGEMDWDSDVDSVHSLDSSLDIWLQQGKDPKALGQDRSESPDLFNFPPSLGGGWTTHPTFEPTGGAFKVPRLVQGASNPAEDLLSAQKALFPDAVQPPPAPHRRSSLGAKTGPTSSRHPPVNGKLRKSPSRSGSRRNSVDAQMMQLAESAANTPQQLESKSVLRSKDSHYPPSSGSTPRGNRLNFFRRSIGGGSVASPPEPAHSPATTEQAAPAGAKLGPMGVPSWVQRSNGIDDDRASATPPPIMRNPRAPRSVSVDEGAPIYDRSPATPATPMTYQATPTPAARGAALGETTPTNNGANGGASLTKRKWLPGFGRTSSLRNRAG